jgi:toxin ParE1/3/4
MQIRWSPAAAEDRQQMEGTRELPLPPLPFIVIYRVLERADAVEIVNVIHGAQRWPPGN